MCRPRPPRPTPRTALALLALGVLLWTLPAAAYTIYLQDGTQIVARDKYEVRDGRAYFTLQNGTDTVLDLDQIDVERTKQANRNNLGTAVVLEGEVPDDTLQEPRQEEQRPGLSQLVRQRQAQQRQAAEEQARNRQAEEASRAEDGSLEVPRTPAGYPDLLNYARRPYPNLETGAQIKRFFSAQGIDAAQVFQGTEPGRPLVEVTTSAEASAFRALAVAASTLIQLRDGGGTPDGLELLLVTPERGRAGQFSLTPEMARNLLSGEVDISTFYLQNVQF